MGAKLPEDCHVDFGTDISGEAEVDPAYRRVPNSDPTARHTSTFWWFEEDDEINGT